MAKRSKAPAEDVEPDPIPHSVAGRVTALGAAVPDPEWAPGSAAHVSELMPALFGKLKLEERLRQHEIRKLWPELVGEFNSQNSFPESIKRGILHVRVANSALKHHMELLRREWVRKLQARLGSQVLKDIRFTA